MHHLCRKGGKPPKKTENFRKVDVLRKKAKNFWEMRAFFCTKVLLCFFLFDFGFKKEDIIVMENDEITPKSSEKVNCECGYYLSKEPWKRRLFSGMSCYRIFNIGVISVQ